MSHTVGVSVTCNSNCMNWCPRSLRVAMCCFRCTSESEVQEAQEAQESQEVRVDTVARKALTEGDADVPR